MKSDRNTNGQALELAMKTFHISVWRDTDNHTLKSNRSESWSLHFDWWCWTLWFLKQVSKLQFYIYKPRCWKIPEHWYIVHWAEYLTLKETVTVIFSPPGAHSRVHQLPEWRTLSSDTPTWLFKEQSWNWDCFQGLLETNSSPNLSLSHLKDVS